MRTLSLRIMYVSAILGSALWFALWEGHFWIGLAGAGVIAALVTVIDIVTSRRLPGNSTDRAGHS